MMLSLQDVVAPHSSSSSLKPAMNAMSTTMAADEGKDLGMIMRRTFFLHGDGGGSWSAGTTTTKEYD